MRYLRLSVLRVFTPSVRPQKNFDETTYVSRAQPSSAIACAHDPLGLAARVGLGVVEEVDAGLARGGEAVAGHPGVELGAEGHPAPEREHADLAGRWARGGGTAWWESSCGTIPICLS